MNMNNRSAKAYIKALPVPLALKLIDEYKIPSPAKEVLITVCVARRGGFSGMDYLSERYGISLGYWTFCERLRDGLTAFYKTHTYYGRDFSEYLVPKN